MRTYFFTPELLIDLGQDELPSAPVLWLLDGDFLACLQLHTVMDDGRAPLRLPVATLVQCLETATAFVLLQAQIQ